MKRPIFVVSVSALLVFALAGCATNRLSEAERLTLYQQHAGAPVRQVHYRDPIGWDRIDDQHVVLQMQPNKSWLLTLSGPCLAWSNGSPFLQVSTWNGSTLSTFDKVAVADAQLSCQIREIRPLDMKAARASESALREQAKAQPTAQPSGT